MLLAYWFLLPALLCLTFTGLGLGVRKLSVPFSAVLLIPIGYAATITLAAVVTYSGHTKDATAPVLLLFALAGYAFSAREIRDAIRGGALRRAWPWMTVGLVGFLLFGLAVLMSGSASYSGYNEIVDIASQMQFMSFLTDFGRHPVGDVSFWANSNNGTPVFGYPAGPQSLLAFFPRLFGFDMAWSWEPYMAIMAGALILSAYALIRQVTDSRLFAALGAFAVGQASPVIGYGHIGGIKELSAAVTMVTAGAILPTAWAREETPAWRAAVPLSVALAGAFSVFSLTVLPWLAILAAGPLIVIWRTQSLRLALTRGGVALVGWIVISLPTLIPAKDSLTFAKAMENELGNLANPVSAWSATGVWITADHRFTLTGTAKTVSVILGAIVIVLAIVGLMHAVRKRRYELLILFGATALGFTLLVAKMGQWIDFKAFCLTAPVMLLLAIVGLTALGGARRREAMWGAWTGVAVLVLVGLFSDELRYGSTTLAPHDRLTELAHYGKEFAGVKSTLIPDWDENGGHQMNEANAMQAFNSSFQPSEEWAADPTRPQPYQYSWDMDQLYPPFANGFSIIVMRRSPGQSRPGRAWKMIEEGRYFQVWKRTDPATVAHLPLDGTASEKDQAKCNTMIQGMPSNATVTIAPVPPFTASATFDPVKTTTGLSMAEGNGSVYFPGIAGSSEGSVDLGLHTGKFELYAISTSRRKTTVTVGGRDYDVQVDPSMAIRQQYLGTVDLEGGVQPVKIAVGGASLQAGTSKAHNAGAFVGSVELVPVGTLHPALVASTAGKVNCATPMDWIETP